MAKQQNNDIFVSYARQDIDIARRLEKDLSNEGYEVYIDPRTSERQELVKDIRTESIRHCKAFILVLSPKAVVSDVVKQELDLAQDWERRILPVLSRAVDLPDKFREQLADLQIINMEHEHYGEGFRALQEALKQEAPKQDVEQENQPIQPNVAAAPSPEVITANDPRLSSLKFIPFQTQIKRRAVPFTPSSDQAQTMNTPWGKHITANPGDFLVSERKNPNAVWPIDRETFEATYEMVRPDTALLKTPFEILPLSRLTGGNPDQELTVQSFSRVQTVRAGDYFLARNKEGQLWLISTGEAARNKEQAAYENNLLTNNRSQRLNNDRAEGEDQLGIQDEVNALAETLLLREVVPPVAVGIMGGWGSGKSFVMHLISKHVEKTRAQKVKKGWAENGNEKDPAIPAYVGHIYQIHFNAWTYAKSNLWASLMDTIFLTLNRQMQLERLLAHKGFSPTESPPSADAVRECIMAGGDDFKKIYVDNIQIDQDEELKPWRENLMYWGRHLLKENLLWNIMRGQQVETLQNLKDTEEQLKQLKARRDQFEKDRSLEKVTIQELDESARQSYFQTIKSVMLAFVSGALSETSKEELQKHGLNEEYIQNLRKEAEVFGGLNTIVTAFRRNKIYWIWTLTFLLITLLLPYIWSTYAVDFMRRSMALAISLLITLMPIITSVLTWARKIINFNLEAKKILEGAYVNQQDKRAQEIANATDKPLPQKISELQAEISKGSLAAYDAQISLLETQAEEQRQWIGPSAKYANLMEFVQSRLDAATYQNQLGLMHQVRQDIDELTYSLVEGTNKDIFPRGNPRVVLYIDDLDRCPPRRVVEVLEAVQLLLNTKLFIVVLGIDTRYVTRALEKEYREILQREGDPSGLDYIEKIIQIPYRVRPIGKDSLQKYLHFQMDIEEAPTDGTPSVPQSAQDGSPGDMSSVQPKSDTEASPGLPVPELAASTNDASDPSPMEASHTEPEIEELIELSAAVIQFKQEDLVDLTACCQRVALTPRSIKRLVNVLKLMKIFWFRAGKEKSILEHDRPRGVKQAAMSLLALSSAYPEVMREVFVHLDALYRQGQEKTELFAAMDNVKLPPGTAREIAWQLQNFKSDITALKAMTSDDQDTFGQITLLDLDFSTFNLIRSFSFVGDPVYWSDVDVEENTSKLNGQTPSRRATKVKRN